MRGKELSNSGIEGFTIEEGVIQGQLEVVILCVESTEQVAS